MQVKEIFKLIGIGLAGVILVNTPCLIANLTGNQQLWAIGNWFRIGVLAAIVISYPIIVYLSSPSE